MASSAGDQNTELDFLGILSANTAIPGEFYSVTLDGIELVGEPQLLGPMVVQTTQNGSFRLYDPADILLLEGTLGKGYLSGSVGGTPSGGYLTTEFGAFTGGSLMDQLVSHPRSSVSISLTDINDGRGMSLSSDTPPTLQDFVADGQAQIEAAIPIPEPASLGLLLIGAGALCFTRRRGRSGRGIGR